MPRLRYIILRLSKDKEKNLESSKRETNHHVQGILRNTFSRYFIRNFEDQKAAVNLLGDTEPSLCFPPCVSKPPLRKMKRLDPQGVRPEDPVPPDTCAAHPPLHTAVLPSSMEIPSAWAVGARQQSVSLIRTTLPRNGLMLCKISATISWDPGAL